MLTASPCMVGPLHEIPAPLLKCPSLVTYIFVNKIICGVTCRFAILLCKCVFLWCCDINEKESLFLSGVLCLAFRSVRFLDLFSLVTFRGLQITLLVLVFFYTGSYGSYEYINWIIQLKKFHHSCGSKLLTIYFYSIGLGLINVIKSTSYNLMTTPITLWSENWF